MSSLQALCDDPGFPDVQKGYFRIEAEALLSEGGTGKEGALFCLSHLWHHYDVGGHSRGRSLRSRILEQILAWLRPDDAMSVEICMQKAKTALAILVAMHYDYRYINRRGWFDYAIEDMWDLPVCDRILVTAAAHALGVDEIPLTSDWNDERIIAFLNA